MIENITVSGFQSLYDVSVPLSPFTVIVGKSSSGKSAFVRACRLLLQNQRGASFVSHGEHTAEVIATFDDGRQVSIERGKTNQYVLDHVNEIAQHTDAQVFTKLGGEVPDEVKNFLGIDPSISIAAQFDPPYLLTASGNEVARTLGALTNVDTVLAAGREASRRKLAAGTTLRVLQAQIVEDREAHEALEGTEARLFVVEGVERQIVEVKAADEAYWAAKTQFDSLEWQVAEFKMIEVVEIPDGLEELSRAAQEAVKKDREIDLCLQAIDQDVRRLQEAEADIVEVPEVDFEIVERAVVDEIAAQSAYVSLKDRMLEFRYAVELEQGARVAAGEAQDEYGIALRRAGVCPTCNQSTTHIHP